MQINDIFEIEQYDEAHKFVLENEGTKIVELEPTYQEVTKFRDIETVEKQEQVVPAQYDDDGNLQKEETTEIVEVPVIVQEEYTEQEAVRHFQIVEIPEATIEELSAQKRSERDALLKATDVYMLIDFPISDEERELYKQYRQYLRDLPEAESFPEVDVMSFKEWGQWIGD